MSDILSFSFSPLTPQNAAPWLAFWVSAERRRRDRVGRTTGTTTTGGDQGDSCLPSTSFWDSQPPLEDPRRKWRLLLNAYSSVLNKSTTSQNFEFQPMVVPQRKLPSAWIFGKFFLRVLILSFKVCIIKNFSNSGVHNLTSTKLESKGLCGIRRGKPLIDPIFVALV